MASEFVQLGSNLYLRRQDVRGVRTSNSGSTIVLTNDGQENSDWPASDVAKALETQTTKPITKPVYPTSPYPYDGYMRRWWEYPYTVTWSNTEGNTRLENK